MTFAAPFEPSGDIGEPAAVEARSSGRASAGDIKWGISCQETGWAYHVQMEGRAWSEDRAPDAVLCEVSELARTANESKKPQPARQTQNQEKVRYWRPTEESVSRR